MLPVRLTTALMLCLAAGAALAQPAAAPPRPAASAVRSVASVDIIETLRASGQFTILLKSLDETNLTALLKTRRNLTLLAPTDAAFNALPPDQLRALTAPANAALFQKILAYHLINARVDGRDIIGSRGTATSVQGTDLQINGEGLAVTFDSAQVTMLDMQASNGVIHVVDKVLIPRNMTIPAPPAAPAPRRR